jgi:ribulose kinase
VVSNKNGLGGTEVPAGMKTAVVSGAAPAAAIALTTDDYKDINKLQTEIKKNRRSGYPDNYPNKKTLNIRFFNFGKSAKP